MRSPTSLAIFAGLLCAVTATTGHAFQPLITDDTGTQGTGGNQLEFSVNRDRAETAGVTVTERVLPFTYSRGLSDTLDVFVSANHTRISANVPGADASGSGNPSVGVKWRFYENEASKTSLGIKPELRLPVSESNEAKGLGTGRSSYGVTLLFTQEVPFGAVHANLVVGRDRYRDSLTNPDATTTRLSVTPAWDVVEHWKLAVDLGTETEKAGGNEIRANYFELGAIFSPNKDLDFAFGMVRRRANDTPGITIYSLTTGVTWRFK